MEQYYGGTLRVKPENYTKNFHKWQDLIEAGYIYALGCWRFRKEVCKCSKCRRHDKKI